MQCNNPPIVVTFTHCAENKSHRKLDPSPLLPRKLHPRPPRVPSPHPNGNKEDNNYAKEEDKDCDALDCNEDGDDLGGCLERHCWLSYIEALPWTVALTTPVPGEWGRYDPMCWCCSSWQCCWGALIPKGSTMATTPTPRVRTMMRCLRWCCWGEHQGCLPPPTTTKRTSSCACTTARCLRLHCQE